MTCAECGATADENARGWRAYRGDEPDESPLLVFYCPECAEREFADEDDDGRTNRPEGRSKP